MKQPTSEPPEDGSESDVPTDRTPELRPESARPGVAVAPADDAAWDSELPTRVVTDRPLLPRPPRTPRI